ncbi:MAG: outer membrane beta-barrel protein [Candidatus Acidiferrales bacterium]
MRSSFSALGKRFGFWLAGIVAFVISLPATARAQNFADNSKWELGGHYATLSLPSQCTTATSCDTKDNGLGANLTYNFSSWLGFDSEMDFFGDNGDPSTTTTGGRTTEGLFGFRLGPTTRRWGLYSVVRPGFVNFSNVLGQSQAESALFSSSGATAVADATQFTARLSYQTSASSNPLAVLGLTNATDFAFNYGEAIEYRPTKHAALRFDIGDTIVTYPGTTLGTPLHQHNFQISEAFVIRF